MKGIPTWWVYIALGLYFAKEVRDWRWWYYWEDDEDEPNPAPFLCSTWKAWRWLRDICWYVELRVWWPIRDRLERIYRRFCVPPPPSRSAEEDGLTSEEWLLIEMEGIWNLERYEGRYDQRIRKNWEEHLKSRAECDDSAERAG